MSDVALTMDGLDRLLRRLTTATTARGALPTRDPEHAWQALEELEGSLGRELLTDKLLGHALELFEIEAAYGVLDSRRAARGR